LQFNAIINKRLETRYIDFSGFVAVPVHRRERQRQKQMAGSCPMHLK
jgi:hypothetical protein